MSKRKPLTDEQLDAIWKEMLKPNSRKPLTLEDLRGQGYAATVCKGWKQAAGTIEIYLKGSLAYVERPM